MPVNAAIRLDDGPLCSFTFDDCPTSALAVGGAKLESVGAHGTYFIAAGMSKPQRDSIDPLLWGSPLAAARSAGHELGCHTFSHRSLASLRTEEIDAEFEKNLCALREVLPDVDLVSFSYPFGEVSVRAKRAVTNRFGVGRGVREGLNGRIIDLSELRAVHIFSRTFDRDRISSYIANVLRRRAWLVFITHDIRNDPGDWGCTSAEFEFVVDAVRRANIEILTLRAALGRVTHRTLP